MSIRQIRSHLLVIGGTGFIGYHLVKLAKKKGWKVTSISINKPKNYRYVNGVNYIKADIRNLAQLKKKLSESFTYVVNLGGYVIHDHFDNKTNSIINTHFLGVVNLTKFFLKKKIRKFIQIGSSVEYGEILSPQREDVVGLPNSSYALSKLAATNYLLMLHDTQKFPATILRLFQVYGPQQDQNRVLSQIINGCLKNKKFPTSKGDQIRDFCYVDDVVKAIFLALSSKKANGQIINIGCGKPKKVKQIVNQICKIIGKGKPQFGKIKYRKGENMKMYPSIKKARTILSWKPRISFYLGIKRMINSFNQ